VLTIDEMNLYDMWKDVEMNASDFPVRA